MKNKIFVSHRGNTSGVNLNLENNPQYVLSAIEKGFDCEIDLRYDPKIKKLFLGHDKPEYEITLDWLLTLKNRLWIHCKNFESLSFLISENVDLNYFWHQEDDFTLTSKGYIWTYPGKKTGKNSIIVSLGDDKPKGTYLGICSDHIEKVKKLI